MVTSLNEESLEALIVAQMTAAGSDQSSGPRWAEGDPDNYDRAFAVDLVELTAFLQATQPEVVETLDLAEDSTTRRKFLSRLQGDIAKHGVVAVLRNGLQHGAHAIALYY